jgi:prepilin-type processing-associated H-X9-DG protein
MAGKMNPHQLQPVKGKENIVPLGKLNPNLIPAPKTEDGLVSPRMEPVLEPRFQQDGLLCAVGAVGDSLYGLFVQNVENRFLQDEEPSLPMRWDYLGCIPTWDSKIASITITALASFDGSPVFTAANASFQDGHVETRIFTLDSQTGVFTNMPLSTAIFNSTVNALLALGDREVYGVTAGGSVIHWPAITFTGARIWEQLGNGSWTAPLTSLTADPTTHPPTLFVGAVGEVHVSVDHGKTWQKTALGLPTTFQVSDLRYVDDGAGQRIYLSTYGRSTWVADKIERGWG